MPLVAAASSCRGWQLAASSWRAWGDLGCNGEAREREERARGMKPKSPGFGIPRVSLCSRPEPLHPQLSKANQVGKALAQSPSSSLAHDIISLCSDFGMPTRAPSPGGFSHLSLVPQSRSLQPPPASPCAAPPPRRASGMTDEFGALFLSNSRGSPARRMTDLGNLGINTGDL